MTFKDSDRSKLRKLPDENFLRDNEELAKLFEFNVESKNKVTQKGTLKEFYENFCNELLPQDYEDKSFNDLSQIHILMPPIKPERKIFLLEKNRYLIVQNARNNSSKVEIECTL